MANYDVIVIGAGLGGLTAAATLASTGPTNKRKKVLVLEQSATHGGMATTFSRAGVTCETSLQMLGYSPNNNNIMNPIFKMLGINDNITFVPIPEYLEVVLADNNKRITLPKGYTEIQNELIKLYPDAKDGIIRFFSMIKSTSDAIPSEVPHDMSLFKFFMTPFTRLWKTKLMSKYSLNDILDKCFGKNSHEELRTVILSNFTFYGDDPNRLAFTYYAYCQNTLYSGATYIKGGSQKLTDHLVKVIKENGGNVLYNARVSGIKVNEEYKVSGVSYVDSNGKTQFLQAPAVIASVPKTTVNAWLPELARDKGFAKLELGKLSLSSIYIVTDKPMKEIIGKRSYERVFVNNSKCHSKIYPQITYASHPNRDFVLTDYSQIDSGLAAADGKSFASINFPDTYENWASLTEAEYKSKKLEIVKIFQKKLLEIEPALEGHIVHMEMATPKTLERYTLAPNGLCYGHAQYIGQAYPNRGRSKANGVHGLYYGSQWASIGSGFVGAMLGGYWAARDVQKPTPWIPHVILYTFFSLGVFALIWKLISFFV